MSTLPPKLSLIDLCLQGPVAELLKKKDGYLEIDSNLLKALCDEIMSYQSSFNWNAYNAVKVGNLEPEDVPGYQKMRPMPSHPKPFASWLEFSVQYFGGLKDLEREPVSYRIPYFVEHEYRPDNIDSLNDRIIFEIKGAIRSLEEARKYVSISKQYKVHFVFVLQCADIVCPWNSYVRKDGSRMTLEEWCVKSGFDFCYAGKETEFRASERYKMLVKTVGKGLGSFADELIAKRKRIEARKKSMIKA